MEPLSTRGPMIINGNRVYQFYHRGTCVYCHHRKWLILPERVCGKCAEDEIYLATIGIRT